MIVKDHGRGLSTQNAHMVHIFSVYILVEVCFYIGLTVAKFYGRLRLIRSVLRAATFSVLKLIESVITSRRLALACFDTFWATHFNFL